MKQRICFIVMLPIFYCLPQKNYAQRNLIISAINKQSFKQQFIDKGKVVEYIEHKSKTGNVNILQFDSSVLKDSTFILNVFHNEIITVKEVDIDKRGENDFSFYGSIQNFNNKTGSAVFTYFNGELSGNLNYKFKNYAIHPLGKGKIAVYEIDFSEYPKDDAHPSIKEDTKNSNILNYQKSQTTLPLTVPPCPIRILVAYTPDAENQIKNMLGYSSMVQFINQAIAETNQGYLNSNINFKVELASATRVNYTESGNYDTDLGRFQSANDGYMDEIHRYRNAFSADVSVLIFNNSSACGLASAIQANASSAFCVVDYDCVLGNYSFGHEIAHLFGCRHNTEADDNTEPFAYGHGYVYQSGNWRTIMAYEINDETRVQFYSNPDIKYNNIPTGTANVNNNARVLNENAGAVGAFRNTESVVALNGTTGLIDDETGDVTAISVIFLEPGFKVVTNSVFDAHIKNCGDLIASQNRYIATANKKEDFKTDIIALSIYPNPTKGQIRITGARSDLENAEIIVTDQLGNEVYKSFNKSDTDIVLDLSYLNSGIYYIRIITSNKATSKKVVIIK